MKKLVFSARFVETIMRGVRSVTFLVMFNEAKTECFKLTRGIRQGDLISPYLFLLAAEDLSCLLKKAMNYGDMIGIHVASTAPKVNHRRLYSFL
jgi:hypothetical protein